MSFKYFHKGDKDQFQFYRMPVQVFKSPPCKDLTAEAKLLITYMLDRRALSVKSGWHDEQGRIYIYYPLHQICDELSVGKQKAVHMLDELEKAELIKRSRQGLGRPSRIYVGIINNPDRSVAVQKPDYTRSNQLCETDRRRMKPVCKSDSLPEVVRDEDNSEAEVVRNTDRLGSEVVHVEDHERSENQPPMRALDRLIEECKRDSTYINKTYTENLYTKSDSGDREPASKEAYEREMPKTREEVLEEYRQMKARGEEDMRLVELMLLATNDSV